MKELKRIFSFLNDTCKRECYKIFWIIALIDCVEVFIKAQIYYSKKREYVIGCLHDNHVIVFLIAVLIIGFLYGSREFDGYIKIAAKRKEYLRGVFIYSASFSLVLLVLNRIFTLMLSALVIYIVGIPMEFYSNVDLLKEWLIYLWGMHLGFLIGAIFYRMQKRTFWGMSFIVGYVLLRIALGGYFLGMDMEDMQQNIWNLAENFERIGFLLVLVFMSGSGFLLRKAPIKTYAHDML